ncbi:MAG: hemerythrin domain-containing protein [Pyrinomonadaceae bacterium]
MSSGRSSSEASSRSESGSSKTRGASTASSSKPPSGKGIVGRVAAAVVGLVSGGEQDVLELLKADHRVVDGYFKEVKANEDASHGRTFKKIKSELDVHAHVEEVIFYPYLMEAGSEELKKIVREGVEEHVQMKTLLAELSELKGSDDVFKAKLKVLMENVEHHVEEEEDEMFSLVEDEVDRETLTLLAERVEKEKANFASNTKSESAAKTKGRAARR